MKPEIEAQIDEMMERYDAMTDTLDRLADSKDRGTLAAPEAARQAVETIADTRFARRIRKGDSKLKAHLRLIAGNGWVREAARKSADSREEVRAGMHSVW